MRALLTCAAIVPTLAVMMATLEPSQRPRDTVTASASPHQGPLPRPPQESIDIATLPNITRRVKVNRGESLQQAIDQARPGDQMELEPGVYWRPRGQGSKISRWCNCRIGLAYHFFFFFFLDL